MAKKLIAALADSSLFLREWFVNPHGRARLRPVRPTRRRHGAVAPANPESYVLELGPGTGAVTEALIERGLREDRLVAIEHNPKLAQLLRKRFPGAHIITGDAWHLDELLRERPDPIETVGAVISSLPLVNFAPDEAEGLAQKIGTVLEPQGTWVQYSYHIHKRRTRGTSRFRLLASKIVWFNLPPARVSVFQK